MRALLVIALIIMACNNKILDKSLGINTNQSSGGGGGTTGATAAQSGSSTASSEPASSPALVTGVYLACSPVAVASSASSVSCVMAEQSDKQPLTLQSVLNRWLFNYSTSASQAVEGVTVSLNSQTNGFQLSAQGGTSDQQQQAINQAVVQMTYQTKDSQDSKVNYPLSTAIAWNGNMPQKPVTSPGSVASDTGTLNLGVTFTAATGGGLSLQQTLDPEATGVTFTMHGGSLVDQSNNPYTSKVLFGSSVLVVNNFWMSYDLAFDKAGKRCSGTVVFLLSSTQLTNNMACQ